MKKNLIYFATIFLLVVVLAYLYIDKESEADIETVTDVKPSKTFKNFTFLSKDSLNIHADLYDIHDEESPIIILFHQARYSRGEYQEIAPRLNDLGFTCLAVDQRSGKEVHDVLNQTHKEAVEKGKAVTYPDAYPDMEAALQYVKNNYPNRKIIIWGSSYSAALSFVLAQKYQADVSAIVAFSPGEYFEFETTKISDFAKEVTCPVFITSAGDEGAYWEGIYENLPKENKKSYLPDFMGVHGSSALLEDTEGSEKYWVAVKRFLADL